VTLLSALVVAVIAVCGGCSRGRGIAVEGEHIQHDRGFSVVVPPGWTAAVHEDGVSLAAEEMVGEGFPTIRIEVVSASRLPPDFLSGRSFKWASGRGSYRNRRWANTLGNGYGLDVHLRGEDLYLVVQAEVWDRRVTRDGAYFRKEIWPIVNSIVEGD